MRRKPVSLYLWDNEKAAVFGQPPFCSAHGESTDLAMQNSTCRLIEVGSSRVAMRQAGPGCGHIHPVCRECG